MIRADLAWMIDDRPPMYALSGPIIMVPAGNWFFLYTASPKGGNGRGAKAQGAMPTFKQRSFWIIASPLWHTNAIAWRSHHQRWEQGKMGVFTQWERLPCAMRGPCRAPHFMIRQ
jgi:hypothetical protein